MRQVCLFLIWWVSFAEPRLILLPWEPAQQTLKQMGIESSTPALGCAVAYPMGVIGVILAVLLIRKFLVHKEDLEIKEKDDANKTFIAAFQVT